MYSCICMCTGLGVETSSRQSHCHGHQHILGTKQVVFVMQWNDTGITRARVRVCVCMHMWTGSYLWICYSFFHSFGGDFKVLFLNIPCTHDSRILTAWHMQMHTETYNSACTHLLAHLHMQRCVFAAVPREAASREDVRCSAQSEPGLGKNPSPTESRCEGTWNEIRICTCAHTQTKPAHTHTVCLPVFLSYDHRHTWQQTTQVLIRCFDEDKLTADDLIGEVYIYACMHACMHVCVFMCVYICKYKHIHTYICPHVHMSVKQWVKQLRTAGTQFP
jgi:hypothetical protein